MTPATATLTHSERLRNKLMLVLPELNAAAAAMNGDPRIRELYPEYLFVTHCMVRATVPLMCAAVERASQMEGDAVAAAIVPYLKKHIPEEMHDHWPLEDFEATGRNRAEILDRQPPPAVAAMVGSQYYWIFHAHPVALFGYMEIMEGYPPSVEQVHEMVQRTGYPFEAFRTLYRHSMIDVEHRAELHEVLDSLPLTAAHTGLIGLSALETVAFGTRAIREMLARHQAQTIA